MKKSILLSLALVAALGAGVMGATGAFFSDTETSTGNTFTAGDIDLRIDNESYVTDRNGRLVASPANSWQLSNLTNQLFFSFADVKPGDIGEDTISIHPGTNDAWACMALDVTATPENSLLDPETDAGDVVGPDGELQNYLKFTFWRDDGDNVFETGEQTIPSLTNVTTSSLQGQKHTIADSGTGTPLAGNGTYYVAKAWCFGELSGAPIAQDQLGKTDKNGPLARGTGFACSGAGNQNIAQTDGVVMDVSFEAVQSRNNGEFLCTPTPPPSGGV